MTNDFIRTGDTAISASTGKSVAFSGYISKTKDGIISSGLCESSKKLLLHLLEKYQTNPGDPDICISGGVLAKEIERSRIFVVRSLVTLTKAGELRGTSRLNNRVPVRHIFRMAGWYDLPVSDRVQDRVQDKPISVSDVTAEGNHALLTFGRRKIKEMGTEQLISEIVKLSKKDRLLAIERIRFSLFSPVDKSDICSAILGNFDRSGLQSGIFQFRPHHKIVNEIDRALLEFYKSPKWGMSVNRVIRIKMNGILVGIVCRKLEDMATIVSAKTVLNMIKGYGAQALFDTAFPGYGSHLLEFLSVAERVSATAPVDDSPYAAPEIINKDSDYDMVEQIHANAAADDGFGDSDHIDYV